VAEPGDGALGRGVCGFCSSFSLMVGSVLDKLNFYGNSDWIVRAHGTETLVDGTLNVAT